MMHGMHGCAEDATKEVGVNAIQTNTHERT